MKDKLYDVLTVYIVVVFATLFFIPLIIVTAYYKIKRPGGCA